MGSRVGVVVRALAFHQCVPGSIPGPGVICGLSLLVLYSAPRGFSPGTPVFPSPQKPTFDLIWFDLFDLQSPQLVQHSCSARMIWDSNKVIIIIIMQMHADHFSADTFRSYEFVRLRKKGLKQQDLDVVIVINIFSFSRWTGPLWFIG